MPLSFLRRKKENKAEPRVTIFQAQKEKEVTEAIEAGLFPARVASRNGVKLAQYGFKVALLALVAVVLVSAFGLLEPLRKVFQPIQNGNGTLIVSSDYVSTRVLLDGKTLGQTPFTGENIPSGKHKLKVQAVDNTNSFFKDSEFDITINPGNTTIVKANVAPLEALFSYTVISSENRTPSDALLIVKALPQGVVVKIDGENMGIAPYVTESITAGAHQLLLEKEGYKPVLIDITIADDKVISIEAKLYQFQIDLEK